MAKQVLVTKKEKKNNSGFIGFIFLLFAVLVGTYALHENKQQVVRKSPSQQRSALMTRTPKEERVNLHLRMMEQAKVTARHRVERENRKTAPEIGEGYQPDDKSYWHLDMQPDDVSVRVYNDIKRESKTWETPDGQIQEYLADEEKRKAYEQAYREEFVRAYKENARRQGYNVKISKDYVIEEVTPIRNPSSPSASGGVD
ncbi:MAG: hypothetical protein AB7H97_12085 [Pseudobdellovibrionaceae bacterium]